MGENEKGLMVLEERSVADVTAQVQKIQDLLATVMVEGEHYGPSFPGDKKKNLLKPGADKLCFTFRLSPEYDVKQIDLPNYHREIQVKTTIRSLATGAVISQGLGSCSTLESKYRWRNSARKCPECGKEAIIKGKAEYGGGWVCFKKKDGCGAKFAENDPAIVDQPAGKVENPDIADVWNTVLKIAKKRSYVDATITATAASDIFTQDAEDFQPDQRHETKQAEDASVEYQEEGSAEELDRASKSGKVFDDRPLVDGKIKARMLALRKDIGDVLGSVVNGKAIFSEDEKALARNELLAVKIVGIEGENTLGEILRRWEKLLKDRAPDGPSALSPAAKKVADLTGVQFKDDVPETPAQAADATAQLL